MEYRLSLHPCLKLLNPKPQSSHSLFFFIAGSIRLSSINQYAAHYEYEVKHYEFIYSKIDKPTIEIG